MSFYKGVLDRIEEGKYAVVIIEGLNKEFIVEPSLLPEDVHDGARLRIQLHGENIDYIEYDKKESQKTAARVSKKMEVLRESKKGSRFRKK